MIRLLLFLFLLCISCLSNAQGHRKEIGGSISDKLGYVINAHIINTSAKLGAFSNDNGEFIIKAKIGDEIQITSIQHHTLNVIVTEHDIKTNRLDFKIHLKEYVLEEIEVKKTDLSGVLSADAGNIRKSDREKVMDNLGFNPHPKRLTKIEREIKTAYAGGIQLGLGALVSLDYLINSMSGRIDMLEKQKKLLDNEERLVYLKDIHKNYITGQLKIDSTDVSRFLYFCHLDKNFNTVYYQTEFEMMNFLEKQAKLFKDLKEK